MAVRQNAEEIEDLEERVDELEDRVRDLEVSLWLPWPLRLVGRFVDE